MPTDEPKSRGCHIELLEPHIDILLHKSPPPQCVTVTRQYTQGAEQTSTEAATFYIIRTAL